MEYKFIPLENLAYNYIISENGEVYKVDLKTKKNKKVVPLNGHARLKTKEDKYISVKVPYLLAGAFYGGYLPRRKVFFKKVNKQLHIDNIIWAQGFEKGIDYKELALIKEENLTEENKNLRLYLLTKDFKYLNKIVDSNKGLYYTIFKDNEVLSYYNGFIDDLRIKLFKMADAGLLKPEEHSNRMKAFFRLVCKYYIFNVFTKNGTKKEVEYKDYKETNLSYDFEEDFDNLEDEIGDMFNYFSN